MLTSIGSYRLVHRLGTGGMGEVWLAQHQALGRYVAIKIMLPIEEMRARTPNVQSLVERFGREARTTASLRSPHIVNLFDYGTTGDGRPYLVMECLDGWDLHRIATGEGPMPPERVVHVMRQLCLALRVVHAAGLVHRDVKPGNILLCRHSPEPDHAMLIDFGLVTAPSARTSDVSQIAPKGAARGTPEYMAPEVALGRHDCDGRADLYSLACTAYRLLTGTDAFTGPNPQVVLEKHVHSAPVPPSLNAPYMIPPMLDGLIMCCLAKRPERRVESAAALLRQLDAIHFNFERPWTRRYASRWWRRQTGRKSSSPDTLTLPQGLNLYRGEPGRAR